MASEDLFSHLVGLYAKYRQTKNIEDKGVFLSPGCIQICRQDPSYAAKDRQTIIHHVYESGPMVERILQEAGAQPDPSATKTSYYTVRPTNSEETLDFGSSEHVIPAGLATPDQVRNQAIREGWVGIKVNMWEDDGHGQGLLVKVKYWYRLESLEKDRRIWRQCLHDILYIGPRDGSEAQDGGIIYKDA